MGQYGNQPDFGTIVTSLATVGLETPFPPSAIYVGKTTGGEVCTLTVLPVGNDPDDTIAINGIPQGTFLPIVVVRIDTIDVVEPESVLLYR
jgi:hypothetical protein